MLHVNLNLQVLAADRPLPPPTLIFQSPDLSITGFTLPPFTGEELLCPSKQPNWDYLSGDSWSPVTVLGNVRNNMPGSVAQAGSAGRREADSWGVTLLGFGRVMGLHPLRPLVLSCWLVPGCIGFLAALWTYR